MDTTKSNTISRVPNDAITIITKTRLTIFPYFFYTFFKVAFYLKPQIPNLTMPQLLPFYFVNQITFALAALFIITYIMSVYVLPYFVALFVSRVYITKL
jgi:F-type H+-transporting ATPase subunit 8